MRIAERYSAERSNPMHKVKERLRTVKAMQVRTPDWAEAMADIEWLAGHLKEDVQSHQPTKGEIVVDVAVRIVVPALEG